MGRRASERRPEEARGAPSGAAAEAPGSLRRVDTDVRARSHRQGGPSQDRAVYNCGCGYVFDALVSTSVDCPHCGDAQAW
jgi:hypothetical protein